MQTQIHSPPSQPTLGQSWWLNLADRLAPAPDPLDAERARCKADVAYFIDAHVQILNATDETWRPFALWPAQRDVLQELQDNRQVIVLKARQLGLTWLCLAFALWRMVFYPIATVGIFSRREEDAQELLDIRLKGMYARLPDWMRQGYAREDNKTRWQLSSGSTAMAFATNGGRQYTFSLAMVDEADFQPDLPSLISAVKPAIDAGGRMWLISSANKDLPESRFKKIFRAAKSDNSSEWSPVFLPWHARPERTPAWYEQQKAETLQTTGALDDIAGEYPASPTEALAPRSLDKRIPAQWIEACYEEREPLPVANAPALPNLEIYAPPQRGLLYVIGIDPAEGNPTSDDSALCVMTVTTGEAVAEMSGKLEPSVLADYAHQLAAYYNQAGLMVERNNHGHAVILWLHSFSPLRLLEGSDGRYGWLSNALGKVLMYNEAADHFRTSALAHSKILHSLATYTQLASIEGGSLRAPKAQHDDRADAFALANVGRAVMMMTPQGDMIVYDEAVQISPY